jgi:hypothetical protein
MNIATSILLQGCPKASADQNGHQAQQPLLQNKPYNQQFKNEP